MPEVCGRELTRLTDRGQRTRQAIWVELNTEPASVLESHFQLEMPEDTEAHDS